MLKLMDVIALWVIDRYSPNDEERVRAHIRYQSFKDKLRGV